MEDEEASATVEWESEGEHEEDEDVNALARFMTTANAELYVLSKGVLRYLKGVKSRKIVWCASRVKVPFVPCVTLRDAKTGIKDRYEPGM